MEHRVESDGFRELGQLRLIRKLAMNEQPTNLQKAGMFRKFLNGVAAVAQNALFSIDERDGTLAGARVGIAWVEGDEPGFGSQAPNIKGPLMFGAFDDRKRVRFARNLNEIVFSAHLCRHSIPARTFVALDSRRD